MAVAIQQLGYTNVKIYNGGLKDWEKAGNPILQVAPLPDYEIPFIDAFLLQEMIDSAKKNKCLSPDNKPVFTLLDIRTEKSQALKSDIMEINTNCPVISALLDDLLKPEMRRAIPFDSPVIIVTETGNRDKFAGRFMYKYGYTNLLGLKFGMRGWIKADYPIRKIDGQ